MPYKEKLFALPTFEKVSEDWRFKTCSTGFIHKHTVGLYLVETYATNSQHQTCSIRYTPFAIQLKYQPIELNIR